MRKARKTIPRPLERHELARIEGALSGDWGFATPYDNQQSGAGGATDNRWALMFG